MFQENQEKKKFSNVNIWPGAQAKRSQHDCPNPKIAVLLTVHILPRNPLSCCQKCCKHYRIKWRTKYTIVRTFTRRDSTQIDPDTHTMNPVRKKKRGHNVDFLRNTQPVQCHQSYAAGKNNHFLASTKNNLSCEKLSR